jgi:hypothetical protein
MILGGLLLIAFPAIIAGIIYVAWEPSLDESRDIVIIVYAVLGATFFFAAIVVTAAVGMAVIGLFSKMRSLMDESVSPTLQSVKDAADTVRGTTEFVTKTAITPVVKTYGAFAGLKKGLSVLGKVKGK